MILQNYFVGLVFHSFFEIFQILYGLPSFLTIKEILLKDHLFSSLCVFLWIFSKPRIFFSIRKFPVFDSQFYSIAFQLDSIFFRNSAAKLSVFFFCEFLSLIYVNHLKEFFKICLQQTGPFISRIFQFLRVSPKTWWTY